MDHHIVQKSDIPDDIIMVDRDLKIEDDVTFYQARLAILDFTRGKKQLHPLEVEYTRKIVNACIHVEQVIELVVRKFRIFEGEVPVEILKIRNGRSTATIEKIFIVFCSLINWCPSIVPFD